MNDGSVRVLLRARVLEADTSTRRTSGNRHGGEPEPERVGAHPRSRGPVGEEIELAFLIAILHVASRAVDAPCRSRVPCSAGTGEVMTPVP